MKKVALTILAFAFIALSITANAQKVKSWTIDKSHASVRFEIDHFFSSVPGKFNEFSGDIKFSQNDLENSQVTFNIKAASVDTDNEDRDKHLQSDDFFHAEKHPEITFKSNKFEKVSDNEYLVHGEFTMRGTTKTIALPLTITGKMDNPWAEGKVILGVSVETTINRTDYGVGTGSWAATTTVGDEVRVDISMELDGKK